MSLSEPHLERLRSRRPTHRCGASSPRPSSRFRVRAQSKKATDCHKVAFDSDYRVGVATRDASAHDRPTTSVLFSSTAGHGHVYPLLPLARAFRDAGHEVALATAPSWKERARRCTAVVSHAGSGSTLGALAHGLPMLLVPQGADQCDNAAACEAAGAEIVIAGPSLEAGAVAAAVDALLAEPSCAEAARRIAAELALMGSPEEVVALLARRSVCT